MRTHGHVLRDISLLAFELEGGILPTHEQEGRILQSLVPSYTGSIEALLGRSPQDRIAQMLPQGTPVYQVQERAAQFELQFLSDVARIDPRPDVVSALERIAGVHAQILVFSWLPRLYARAVFGALNMTAQVTIWTRDQVDRANYFPAPDLVTAAVSNKQRKTEETVFFGTTIAAQQASNDAGVYYLDIRDPDRHFAIVC